MDLRRSIFILAAVACRVGDPDGFDIVPSLAPPSVEGIRLAAHFTLQADRPCVVQIAFTSDDHARTIAPPDAAADHDLPILGLRADQHYDVAVTCTDLDGGAAHAALTWDTEPLPDRFPRADVVAHDPDRMEPGYTLLNLSSPGIDYVVVLDRDLEVVWLYEQPAPGFLLTVPTPDGYLLGTRWPGVFVIDWLGAPVRSWSMAGEGVRIDDPIHHEAVPRADGGFLGLISRALDATIPVDYTLSATTDGRIVDDGVIEMAADGTVERVRWLADVLDPGRIGFDALDPTRDFPDAVDWGHANAALADPADDGVIVSLRNQDAVVKLAADGSLEWILGTPSGWTAPWTERRLTPSGPLAWPYHQHAPALAADGALVLFDNGNLRASPYDADAASAERWSGVAAYRVDAEAMTVEQLWRYRDTLVGELYSPSGGDADPQPHTGNVLALYGRTQRVDGVANGDLGRGDHTVHLIELDPAALDDPPLHLVLYSTAAESQAGWGSYRAERMPGFYLWER